MTLRPYILVCLAFVSGCTLVRGKGAKFQPHDGAAENAFQTRYYTIREETPGFRTCAPKAQLQSLLEDPYHCGPDLTACKASHDAVAGLLDAAYVELFAATLARTEGEFDYTCRGGENPKSLHLIGLAGLGLLDGSEHLDRLLALDDVAQRDSAWHVAMRPALALALFQTGDRERALPKVVELAQLENGDETARASAVLYVGRWQSDGLIDTCTKNLSQPTSDALAQSCAWYLGHRKVADALPLLGNTDPRLGLAGIRALGISGDARATEMVTRLINPSTASDVQRIAARVALLNLGKKEALRDYLYMLSGAIGARKAANTAPKLSPDDVAREAALEVLALTNRSFDKDIIKALKKTTAIKNEQTAAAAWLALAYLGEDSAFDTVAQLIGTESPSLRKLVITHIGGHAFTPGRHSETGGDGVLVDGRLRTALLAVLDSAPNEPETQTALASTRAARNE